MTASDTQSNGGGNPQINLGGSSGRRAGSQYAPPNMPNGAVSGVDHPMNGFNLGT